MGQKRGLMARKRYTAEQILGHLRQAKIRISEGKTVAEVVRELGVSEQTYYRWRKEYGGMEVEQLRRLKELEQENGRLKRLVADQALDNAILKSVWLPPYHGSPQERWLARKPQTGRAHLAAGRAEGAVAPA